MKLTTTIAAVSSILVFASCGNDKPAPAPPSSAVTPTEIVCSYAPSQSAVVANLTGTAGGSAAAAAALAQALGLTVVTHSSGALILTGGSGYIAGTIGAAAAGPVVIGVGVVAAGSAGVIELLCAPRNHPEMIAQIEAAASEFAARSKTVASSAASATSSFIAKQQVKLIKSGGEAVAFANRKADEISEGLKR